VAELGQYQNRSLVGYGLGLADHPTAY